MEQIHLAGSIRPDGVLLLVGEPGLEVLVASANTDTLTGKSPGALIGTSLDALGGNLAAQIRAAVDEPLHEIPAAVRCRVGGRERNLTALLHRPPGGGLIVELTDSGPRLDLSDFVCDALRAISATSSLRMLCDESARIFKGLVGYDRVMIYRFDEEGHGEVYSEEREPQLEAFLGNRYPATDIPQIARRLYVRNRIRVLEDVAYDPVPLTAGCSPYTGEPLDMSLCFLRSMSPIHIQYLKNMGVNATLVASLIVRGNLWGLVSCHHYSPRFMQYEQRVACELLAEAVATRIAALQGFAQAQAELSVRRLEQHMIEAIARRGEWEYALFDNPQFLLEPLSATGAALLWDGRVRTSGEVPSTSRLNAIGKWLNSLNSRTREPVFATSSLAGLAPGFRDLLPEASGLLAVPLSRGSGEYLVWFRPERLRTVTWGGNPYKAVEFGDDPSQLSPRRSFAQWHQIVEGTCDPWTNDDLTTGRLLGESVADVIQQFRSLRVLIARDQFQSISAKVRRSDQPVLIADAGGSVVLTNESFDQLLEGRARPQALDDLVPLFIERDELQRCLVELRSYFRSWRGEVTLVGGLGSARPLMVRVDPVLSSPREALGFVLLFTDISERKALEDARRRFQADVVERHRISSQPLKNQADLKRRELLASIVGNAQLAALEITDGPDLSRAPEMLLSVQSAVDRATELLEHLVWYRSRDGDAEASDTDTDTPE